MTYLDLINSLCLTPASRMKLIGIRNHWTDSYKRKMVSVIHPLDGRVVDQVALEAHLHGYLVTFMHSLIAAGVHLDALLMVPLTVPLNRQPITYSRVLDLSSESAQVV